MSEPDAVLKVAAHAAANNHASFAHFHWGGAPPSPEQWTIVHTSNRDSGLRDQSNAAAIEKLLTKDRDIMPQWFRHWAHGWAEGFAIRVYKGGEITPAFRKWHDISLRLKDGGVLDPDDFAKRRNEATNAYLEDEAGSLLADDAPEGWADDVRLWLERNGGLTYDGDAGVLKDDEVLAKALFLFDRLSPEYLYLVIRDGVEVYRTPDRNAAMDRYDHLRHKSLGEADVRVEYDGEVVEASGGVEW